MKKVTLFAFNGEPMCFVHVLLNALDMKEKGYDVRVVIEGAATKLIPDFGKQESPLFQLFRKACDRNLIDGACRACAGKMGTLKDAVAQGIHLLDDMTGHPGMAKYINDGCEIITF